MKLYTLSNNPAKPCYLLQLPEVSILLDCALDLTPFSHFLPVPLVESTRLDSLPGWRPSDAETEDELPGIKDVNGMAFVDAFLEVLPPEDSVFPLDSVDAILLSNYNCMLALPYLTEKLGFKGRDRQKPNPKIGASLLSANSLGCPEIPETNRSGLCLRETTLDNQVIGAVYATDPTVQLGSLLMEELVEFSERISKESPDNSQDFKRPDIWSEISVNRTQCGSSPKMWKPLYTSRSLVLGIVLRKEMKTAISKIQLVAYKERINLFNSASVTPVSSGFCIGSCNWLIETQYDKFVYMSGTSTLTTHPKAIDIERLKHSDFLIMSCLTQTPSVHPDIMLADLFTAVATTLREGGNVLIPCYPSGTVYDLFECLAQHLDKLNLGSIPLYFLSPVAERSLGFSNIFGEWLSNSKQEKVYLPEEPFPHASLVRNGRLKLFKAVYDGLNEEFRTPCVLFAGHPSLRVGDGVHFMELWGPDEKNTIILVEPDFVSPEVLAPFQPLAMKAAFCPIDTCLDFKQANGLLKDLKPGKCYTHESYMKAPLYPPGRGDLTFHYPSTISLRINRPIMIPIRTEYRKMKVEPDLSESLEFSEFPNGLSACPLLGTLSAYNNNLELRSYGQKYGDTKGGRVTGFTDVAPQPSPFGSLSVRELVKGLNKVALETTHEQVQPYEQAESGYLGKLSVKSKEKDCPPVFVYLKSDETQIVCDEKNIHLRQRIAEVILSTLSVV